MEEILFQAKFRAWRKGYYFEAANASGNEVASALAAIASEAGEKSFEFTETELGKASALAAEVVKGKGLAAVAQALTEIKAVHAKKAFEQAPGQELKARVAEAWFLRKAFEQAGVAAWLSEGLFKEKPQAKEKNPVDDGVFLSANCKGWIAIKKTSIDAKTNPAEIAYALAGVSETAQRKGFEFSGIGVDAVRDLAVQASRGKRKGFSSLAEALRAVPEAQLEEKLAAFGDPEVAKALYLSAILESLNYSTIPSTLILQKAFPTLKLPKPKGRFGKKAGKSRLRKAF